MQSISVFCGSSSGNKKKFVDAAFSSGEFLAAANITLVYGGAKIGLMGAVAEGALKKNGKVIGVLPDFMRSKEIAHEGLTQLIITTSMHERKMKMHELSQGAIALPGGFGTMDELFEILTWLQLGLHKNPVGVLNIEGFYDDLEKQIEKMHFSGFLSENHYKMIHFSTKIEDLLRKMNNWTAPETPSWIKSSQT